MKESNKYNEQQFLLSGLHCAGCVRRVEQALNQVQGVIFSAVNLADQTAFVQGDASVQEIIAAVSKLGFGAELLESDEARRTKQLAQTARILKKKRWQFSLALIIGALIMAYGFVQHSLDHTENRIFWFVCAVLSGIALYFSGKDFYIGAWKSLKNGSATMDTLIAMSTGIAWFYSLYLLLTSSIHTLHLYFEASVMILGFINLGKYLELKAKQRSSLALEKLLDLAPHQVTVLEGEREIQLPAKGIKPNMLIKVTTGDRLAVDGFLHSGVIWVDEAMLTGETLPVEKKAGDLLRAGTLVQDGAGAYLADKVGSKTTLARVINAVRHAQMSKPPLAQWVDKIASIFVPVVVVIAIVSALIWALLGYDTRFVLSIFTTVLIIACPCALGLAIPLSTIAGVAKAAENGILVRNMEALQASAEVDTIVFDKTGTLTTGAMEVVKVEYFNITLAELLMLTKSLERKVSHPIAKALCQYAANVEIQKVKKVTVSKGLGVSGWLNEQEIVIGNAQFTNMIDYPIIADEMTTPIFVKVNQQLVGIFYVQDQLRSESKALISQLQQQGYQCIMLTGDRAQTACYFGQKLGLDHIVSQVLPEQKAEYIQQLQVKGHKVAMIGDGINDAPALAQANVGIAMFNGSDIAIEVADLSLMKSGIAPIINILSLSKATLRNMHQSLFGAFIYNIISIPIAAGVLYPFTGWLLNPMIAAAAMALSSITVVLNSQRLLKQQ